MEHINICYFNARSLINKLSRFQSFILSSNFDIVCVTETWLSESFFDQEILPPNFIIYRNDRKTRGGGVPIAIRNSLNATLISKSDHLEAVSIQLHLGNCLNVSLCCMYLPPGSGCNKLLTVVHHLSDILMDDNHLSNSNVIIIVGDFNLPDIDWDTLGSTSYYVRNVL